jgi:hypothetical protein
MGQLNPILRFKSLAPKTFDLQIPEQVLFLQFKTAYCELT